MEAVYLWLLPGSFRKHIGKRREPVWFRKESARSIPEGPERRATSALLVGTKAHLEKKVMTHQKDHSTAWQLV